MLKRKGFTLIEVLIVVIILGILATIAIPQFGKIVERARFAEVASNLHAVKAALAIYYMENNELGADIDAMATSIGVDLGELSVSWTGPTISGVVEQDFIITYERDGGDDGGTEAIYTSTTNKWTGDYSYIPK